MLINLDVDAPYSDPSSLLMIAAEATILTVVAVNYYVIDLARGSYLCNT